MGGQVGSAWGRNQLRGERMDCMNRALQYLHEMMRGGLSYVSNTKGETSGLHSGKWACSIMMGFGADDQIKRFTHQSRVVLEMGSLGLKYTFGRANCDWYVTH